MTGYFKSFDRALCGHNDDCDRHDEEPQGATGLQQARWMSSSYGCVHFVRIQLRTVYVGGSGAAGE